MTRHGGKRGSADGGTATVEFVFVAVLILVPITYVLLAALQLQRTTFASVEAAQAASRAFITAPSSATGMLRAQAAVAIALDDQGVTTVGTRLVVSCTAAPCLTPGGSVRVQVSAVATLGWLPPFLAAATAIPVRAVHVETVDPFEPGRP